MVRAKMIEQHQDLKSITKKNGQVYSVRSNRDRFFYPAEWMSFYDKLKDGQKFTFNFLINTGARINEARYTKVGDCDIEHQRIILRVTKVKAKKGEKNPRPRTIPISSQFAKQLKKELQGRTNDEYVGILSTPAANIAMKKALQRAGIKDWYMFSIHNIRKTLEVWLMALGVDSLPLTAHIGHDIKTAVQHYVSPDIFNFKEKQDMRLVIGDLYAR